MRISYHRTNLTFLALFILPIAAMGYFVQQRIHQRQVTLQVFLANQVDVDRKILQQRSSLRSIQPNLRDFLLAAAERDRQATVAFIKEHRDALREFWQKYEGSYAASERPVLREILSSTQELGLIDEEARVVGDIQEKADRYFAAMLSYPPFTGSAPHSVASDVDFLAALDERREDIYVSLNELADIRYIFAQRIVFVVGGENSAQQGLFNTVFVGLALLVLTVAIIQYFILFRPMGDIMLFLSDLSQGKRGQRLYFSSPIREIKASEEIINRFVDQAEKHEAHQRKG